MEQQYWMDLWLSWIRKILFAVIGTVCWGGPGGSGGGGLLQKETVSIQYIMTQVKPNRTLSLFFGL